MFTEMKVWDPKVMITGSALKIEGHADDREFDGIYLIHKVQYDELTVINHYGTKEVIYLEFTAEEQEAKAKQLLEAGEIQEEDLIYYSGVKITMISQRITEEAELA